MKIVRNISIGTDTNGKALNKQKQVELYLDIDAPYLGHDTAVGHSRVHCVECECQEWNQWFVVKIFDHRKGEILQLTDV
jgi:hypothetical protein